MTLPNDTIVCNQLLQDLLTTELNGVKVTAYNVTIQALEDVISSSTTSDIAPAMVSLTECVAQVCSAGLNDDHTKKLLGILATATRKEPFWRSCFGCIGTSSTCVLDEVVKTLAQHVKDDSTKGCSGLQDALRIIANCCADNYDNRTLFFDLDGMPILLKLVRSRVELDIVIPTIYNICNNYEKWSTIPATMPRDNNDDTTSPEEHSLSYASEQLAAYGIDVGQIPTFELFLSVASQCSPDRKSFVAALVEMSTAPAIFGLHFVLGDRTLDWSYKFVDRLECANKLADQSVECRVYILRGMLNVMSKARSSLIGRSDISIWEFVRLAYSESDGEAEEEFADELIAARKSFMMEMYQLTGDSKFVAQVQKRSSLIRKCVHELSVDFWLPSEGQRKTPSGMKACALIILSQLAASEEIRAQLIDNNMLEGTLPKILEYEESPDVVYPAITLLSRLALSSNSVLHFATSECLQSMRRLLSGKGLGLIVPYEAIVAYSAIIKKRPKYLEELVKVSGQGSVISDLLALFDRTIEAGTKMQVGQFLIEVLRTMFPRFQHNDQIPSDNRDQLAESFNVFLEEHGTRTAEVMTFICSQAEPEEERRHGWFGLGMLCVWQKGRLAIIDAIDHHELGVSMQKAALLQEGPIPQNLKLMLSKMQLCSKKKMSQKVQAEIGTAARIVGLRFVIS